MTFPKVLIFGQPFNNFSGGGITLSNLFKDWPKENIAVTYTGHGLFNVSTDVCDTYYQLGSEEHRWLFPFSLIQRKFKSGIKLFKEGAAEVSINFIQTGFRYKIVNRIFYPALRWFGLFHFVSRISVSKRLRNWLTEFNPQVLYLQVSTREEILFAKDLMRLLKIPSVIHMMDDWPSTISNKGFLKNYWTKKIDREFKELLNQVDIHLSISNAMSVEYMKRYNKHFIAFHNPIETKTWLAYTKTNFILNKDYIKILYSGRISVGITESLLEVASALDSVNNDGLKVKLHIQTFTQEPEILSQLQKYRSVIINPFAKLEQIPKILSEADMLLLANDFNKQGIDYLRLSMPTKASEYMISGTPVLVYSPEETAVSEFFRKNECGICVTKQDKSELISAIQFMINNEECRRKISINAVNYAKEKFDSLKVRREFQGLLISLSEKKDLVYN
jgi:glycosyltransferase involved in cell wall biosynthesis